MLLFYENQPDAISLHDLPDEDVQKKPDSSPIDPFLQYGSHAFLRISDLLHESTDRMRSNREDEMCDEDLQVLNPSSWTYCGPLLSSDAKDLPSSYSAWANASLNSPHLLTERLIPVLKAVEELLTAAGAEHYWLTVRATKPTHDYDMPRWHVDENFFSADPSANGLGFGSSNGSKCWKLATTLLGPSTLFRNDNGHALEVLRQAKAHEGAQMAGHICTSIRCLGCATYADTVRRNLARALSREAVEVPENGELAFFRIGDELGAVHSEPQCGTDRIFVNVIPGTEDDLKALMSRFGINFPRAWCFGNPIGFIPSDEKETLSTAHMNL